MDARVFVWSECMGYMGEMLCPSIKNILGDWHTVRAEESPVDYSQM
jgi:hypothetical protein